MNKTKVSEKYKEYFKSHHHPCTEIKTIRIDDKDIVYKEFNYKKSHAKHNEV